MWPNMIPIWEATGMFGNNKKAITDFYLLATTTGANQTVTLERITPVGADITVYWGDGDSSTVTNGNSGQTSHQYASADTYTIQIENSGLLSHLYLRDSKISATINDENPMPQNLTYLYLFNMSWNWTVNGDMPSELTFLRLDSLTNFAWTVNGDMPSGLEELYIYTAITWTVNGDMPTGLTALYIFNIFSITWTVDGDMPTGLQSLFLYGANITWTVNGDMPVGLTNLSLYVLSGLTWVINSDNPWPTGAQDAITISCPNVTVTSWTNNDVHSIRFENGWSQANVDSCLLAVYNNRNNFTFGTPSMDLLGGSNAAPSGVYQAQCPPSTGNEYKYELINDSCGDGFNVWSIQTA